MATTKIWPVRGWLGQVVIYVQNPEKTELPDYVGSPDIMRQSAQGLEDVIVYAMATNKAVEDEGKDSMRYFVSGVNCTPGSARDEMLATKARYEKQGGIVAYHGYQSFSPGEVTPGIAHEIGIKLANQLWGERFQVLVATHLDRGHIHNHFVCNSVSHVDGRKFRSNKTSYRQMREASDELCYEYGLSVIQDPKPGRSKHYAEWQAEREGKPTWRSIIKKDVDEAIDNATSARQFFDNLKVLGYEIKQGADISVRPPGKERYLRLARNFGGDYTIDGIRQRILSHTDARLSLRQRITRDSPAPKKMPAYPKGSILALHRHYLYLFGFYKRGSPSGSSPNARMHYLLREDLKNLDEIIADEKLLSRESISTDGELLSFQERLIGQIENLTCERTELKQSIRAAANGASYTTKYNPQYQQLNKQIKELSKEVRQCERIADRSGSLKERIERIEKDDTRKPGKEETRTHGRIRTGGRAVSQDDAPRH